MSNLRSFIVRKGKPSEELPAAAEAICVCRLACSYRCCESIVLFHPLSACPFGILPVAGFHRTFSPRYPNAPAKNRHAGTVECSARDIGARPSKVILDAFHPAECRVVGNSGTPRRYDSRGRSAEYTEGLRYRPGSAIRAVFR